MPPQDNGRSFACLLAKVLTVNPLANTKPDVLNFLNSKHNLLLDDFAGVVKTLPLPCLGMQPSAES